MDSRTKELFQQLIETHPEITLETKTELLHALEQIISPEEEVIIFLQLLRFIPEVLELFDQLNL